ncbi:hypothetical protein QEM11_003848 [Pseudomonas putida]|nr:hypothetical protein [Pseudomonas putida]
MRWVWFVLFVFGCAVCGLLGLTAGINLNPASTVKFVPVWGSFGDWVSGIGALLAVVVALWQIHRQQERERPKILLHHHLQANGWSLGVVSDGISPVTVLGAYILYDQTSQIDLVDRLPEGYQLPRRLDRGEVMLFLSLGRIGTALIGKEMIRTRIEHLEANGIYPTTYAKSVNEEYFSKLEDILSSTARLCVRTAHGLEVFDLTNVVYLYLLREALQDARKQADERLTAERSSMQELFELADYHLEKDGPGLS